MPQFCGDERHDRPAQGRLAELREQPQRNPQPGRKAEAVQQRVVGRRLDPAISQPGAIGEKIGRMKFDRGNHGQRGADHQPERRAAEQHEHRHAQGSVNRPGRADLSTLRSRTATEDGLVSLAARQRRPTLIFVMFIHRHSKGLGLAGAGGAGAVAFSTRAVRFDRAAAGSCHSRSVICMATSIGRRTRPRLSSIQPG